MPLIKPPFTREYEKKVRDSFTVNLNKWEREQLETGKEIIKNPQDSAALKKLAWIGLNEIQSDKMAKNIKILFEERRKSKQRGDY